jgi:hypothetical protein
MNDANNINPFYARRTQRAATRHEACERPVYARLPLAPRNPLTEKGSCMTNNNCLEGIKCPQCGNEDRLLIVTTVLADVTDEGADIAEGSDMHWDDASFARCPECDRDGPLREFRAVEIPPDPERMNDERAEWASSALAAFMSQTGTDREDAVADLLCDLMHWCDRNGQGFGRELARAQDHYAAETLGDESTD